MSKPPAPNPRDRVRSFAPKLIELTDNVVFGDVWERPGLSKRDRCVCRKPKPEHSDGEVRLARGVRGPVQ
jgi:hypothetical protein